MPPVSDPAASGNLRPILRSPSLLTREVLAGVLTALALIPEVISFSVIAGVDPQVSLIASVVLCLAMSVFGGRPAMVTAAAGSVALVIGPMVHQHGVGYILPAVILAGIIQILFGLCGMARLMRFIPPAVMTGFVNALGILIFFAQVPHFWSRQPLIVGLFVLTLLIVLWAPRVIKAIPAPLIAIVALTLYTATTGQQLPTVGDEGSMSGGLPGFTALTVPLNLTTLQIIWPCALSIAFVGLMESLLTAKLVDDLTHPVEQIAGKRRAGYRQYPCRLLWRHRRLRDDRPDYRERGNGPGTQPPLNGNRRPGAAPAGDSAQPGDGEDPDGGSGRGDGDRGGEDI